MDLAPVQALNPVVINVSTRGNAESIICALVLATLCAVLERRRTLAAILFGLAVHVKIYPIVYGAALLLHASIGAPMALRSR